MPETKQKPFVVPVFIPHAGCPHECVFCNQSAITGIARKRLTPKELRSITDEYLSYKKPGRYPVQLSFYGGTFLGLGETHILELLEEASGYVKRGLADSIRFSTRPDTVTEKTLGLIKDFPVSTVELGVQSMAPCVLAKSNRGHTADDTIRAVSLLKRHGYEIGLQIMVGLPGDSQATLRKTAEGVIRLMPDFVRIYPAVVLKGSKLEVLYNMGDFQPLSLETCVSEVKKLYLLFTENKITVIRMGLQASQELGDGGEIVAGPYHPSFGHMVYSDIFLDLAARVVSNSEKNLILHVHPKNISAMRGLKNRNVDVLMEAYGLGSVKVVPDESLALFSLKAGGKTVDMESLF